MQALETAVRHEPALAPPAADRWRGVALVVLLLLAAGGLRAWHLRHTEVAARDSIGFIRIAWQMGHGDFREAVAHGEQHPGYPLAILGTSKIVREVSPADDAIVMQRSAQLANSLAGILLVVPMYFLGRQLFGRPTAFWATLLFQCLPASGRILADGLSEGLFLLFAVSGLLFASIGLRTHRVLPFALTGLFSALAYLTRPEGALVVATTGLVLLGLQGVRTRSVHWRRFLTCGLALGLTAIIAGSPLFLITGKLSLKNTAIKLYENTSQAPAPAVPHFGGGGSNALFASTFAVWGGGEDERERVKTLWGVKPVAAELIKGTCYFLWLPMLLGLWWFRDRFRNVPGTWVMLILGVIVTLLLWRVYLLLGYVSDRHLILVLLCGCYWAAAGIGEMMRRVGTLPSRMAPNFVPLTWLRERCPNSTSLLWPSLAMLAIIAALLPKTLEPLHVNRNGFRHAGIFIGQRAKPWDEVLDPYSWSHYYAGKVFQEGRKADRPEDAVPMKYVVLELSGRVAGDPDQPRQHTRLPLVQEAMREGGRTGSQPIYRWTGKRNKEEVEVIVYQVPTEP
jgi:hypothetical protein